MEPQRNRNDTPTTVLRRHRRRDDLLQPIDVGYVRNLATISI